MNKPRTLNTIMKIRKNISNLQYVDYEILSEKDTVKLEEIRLFFVHLSIKTKEWSANK